MVERPRRRRGGRRAAGDDFDGDGEGDGGWALIRRPNASESSGAELNGAHPAVCNEGDATSSAHLSSRSNCPHRRLRRPQNHSYLLHTTCALMATFTLIGAMHHAAFLTRTGRGSLRTQPSGGNLCPNSVLASSRVSGGSGSNGNLLQTNIFGGSRYTATSRRVSSLLMSDTEMQSPGAASDVEDEDEWHTVLAAFQMYKAAYGDLKVPSRFVVPGMAPWPGECHKFQRKWVLFLATP